MKSYVLYLWSAAVLLILGIVLLGVRWNGTSALTGAWPLSNSEFKFCGAATGGLALVGVLALALACISFLVSLVMVVMDRVSSLR
ncbi:MAG TPA: hypothetical protein VFA68_12740 [Terriglobales bacterium]|nr:hypothetical protein [Terriglobales bacterium]